MLLLRSPIPKLERGIVRLPSPKTENSCSFASDMIELALLMREDEPDSIGEFASAIF